MITLIEQKVEECFRHRSPYCPFMRRPPFVRKPNGRKLENRRHVVYEYVVYAGVLQHSNDRYNTYICIFACLVK